MKNYFFSVLIISVLLFSGETLRVGAYDNPPKIFIDNDGAVKGFWADVTNEIAAKEGWNIQWEQGSWDECLTRLEKGEIDLMVDTGLTPEREQKYLFSEETVHLSWTRIYRNPGSEIETVLDLESKTIAGLKNSFDLDGPEGLKKVLTDFEIDAEVIELNTYDEIMASVEKGDAAAGIVDKDYGQLNEHDFEVECTPIVLQPAKMMYAFNKESKRSPVLANTIDARLREFKTDQGSVYYRSFDNFFGGNAKDARIPEWLLIVVGIIIILLIIFIIINRLLRREVSAKSASLKKSEVNFRITLESIGDGVIATDVHGRITIMNRTAQKLTGYNFEEAEGKAIRDIFRIVNAQTRDEVLNPVEIVMRDGRTVGLANHTVLISKNGEEYQIADSAAPIIDETGEIHGMILVFSDITEKYFFQEKMKENERFLNSLISNFNGMIYRCINDGKWSIIYTTPGTAEITGCEPEEFIQGKIRYSDLVYADDVHILKNAIEGSVISKQPFSAEYRITDKHGNLKWVLEKGKCVFDEKGELKFIEGFVTDITITKTAEMSVRRKSDELERSNRLMVDRELKMVELKREINILLKELGREKKYSVNE